MNKISRYTAPLAAILLLVLAAACALPAQISTPTLAPDIVGLITAQAGVRTTPSPVPTTTTEGMLGWGSLKGRILDVATGAPIADAKVTCRQFSPMSPARCDGSLITDAHMKRCVVGIRSVMREGVRLEDTIMMGADFYESEADFAANLAKGIPNVGIGRNCTIKTAIIDKNARIGDNVTLNPVGKPNGHVRDGIAIVDGILVVSKGAVVPAGTVV